MVECIAPEEIQEGDLLAYVEGEASPAVAAHVARCHFCATEVAGLRRVSSLFAGALYRTGCPETDELLYYQAGLLAGADRQRVQQHIQSCPYCQEELQQLAAEPPQPALSHPGSSWLQSLQEGGKEILQALLLPVQPRPALALRGDSRQQDAVYQAGSYQVTLAKVPPLAGENVWQVEGQVVSQAGAALQPGGQVILERNDEPVANDVVDEFGYFSLENVGPGAYTLTIDLTSSLVSLADFTIP
ncbi:MAG: hypothetical protein L0322_31345 [Chloroflexi bacterium]|nr:hypothetical protein [Chloroflexota bacterium]MCI0644364.1 hypothetical protein [Chloroflexota bacterium]